MIKEKAEEMTRQREEVTRRPHDRMQMAAT
jgi:hypothetical protein